MTNFYETEKKTVMHTAKKKENTWVNNKYLNLDIIYLK